MKANTDGLTMNQLAERNAEHVATIAALEARCAALAAENAKLKNPDNWLSHSDYGYEAAEVADQNGATNDESLRAGMIAIINRIETPATDAFLAEVRASAIPEGYALVPQQIFLEPSDIELICSQCGDGHESGYGDFTDGLLWVGNIQRDDGSIVHGLHISSADYTEEGGVTVCEFAAQPRKGVAL
ncbi:TPA: hypothetical protein RU621_000122 [Salmonella enterica]|nr:hypothetical protein [Salmonella enterica]HEA0366635.1 hypothetical protein [Salmonella enterica]HEA2143576.1 hypothetical protein [Salmonella enterica]HEA2152600.1 hypothetical protein [Salmonella enterica]